MDSIQQHLAQFKEEFSPFIKQMGKEELAVFFRLNEWFVSRYCSGYQLEGPIYLVLDNSIIQDFKHGQQKKRWLRALSYVALCRFISIFSDRKTFLCVSPVAVYEHGGKIVPNTAEAADMLVAEIHELLSPCRLPLATIGFNDNTNLIRVLENVHHDAEFMATFAEQIEEMDLRYELRESNDWMRIPMSIATDLIPDDMPLRYFDPWYVKYVFASRIEHKIAAQSEKHQEIRPILSGEMGVIEAVPVSVPV